MSTRPLFILFLSHCSLFFLYPIYFSLFTLLSFSLHVPPLFINSFSFYLFFSSFFILSISIYLILSLQTHSITISPHSPLYICGSTHVFLLLPPHTIYPFLPPLCRSMSLHLFRSASPYTLIRERIIQ